MSKKKEIEKCSLFEEMLMWTSYRYCIGRHTYVTSMAHDMAKHYYNKLSPERREFTAEDIRKEILDHLKWLPFDFDIHRWYNTNELNPLDVLFRFIEEQNVTSMDGLTKFSKIVYHSHEDKFEFDRCEPTIKSYFSVSDIEDLLPWNDLASCFDEKHHKMIVTENDGIKEELRCFKSWRKKVIPCEVRDGVQYVRQVKFGWEPVWVAVDEYLKSEYCGHIPNEYVKEIKNV